MWCAVVEQMARHMRSRGLPQTLGTASALLTAQALQHGRTTAKWLLQPFPQQQHGGGGHGGASPSSGNALPPLELPDEVAESCLLGRGSPQASMQRLMAAATAGTGSSSSSSSRGRSSLRVSTGVANVVLAGLAVRGCTAEAVQLFDWMKEQRRQQQAAASAAGGQQQPRAARSRSKPAAGAGGSQQAACTPNWWTHQLLLYAALNAPREQQLELTLRAAKEARSGRG
jgi:hypothetical protein